MEKWNFLTSYETLGEEEKQELFNACFALLTRYANQGDNLSDNLRRGEVLGFGGRDVKIAPGAIVRIPNKEQVGKNIFIGLYDYINGDVTIEDNTLIGPYCSLTAGNHKDRKSVV